LFDFNLNHFIFSYYNISSNCYFDADRKENLTKALEYFEISFKVF